jgi:hypothetical protein
MDSESDDLWLFLTVTLIDAAMPIQRQDKYFTVTVTVTVTVNFV